MKPFVCLEGIDATGKTSIGREIAREVGGMYYKTPGHMTREERRELERIGLSNPSLRYLSYKNSLKKDSEKISEILENVPVICDRYIFSTVSGHNALGLNLDISEESKDLLMPDITILLVATEERILQRLNQRDEITAIESNIDVMRKNQQDFLSQGHHILDTTNTTIQEASREILRRFGYIFKLQEEFAK